jgi:NAD(P)-dependent dehydrogenase (short-subunit alcohol dehydrogenase family)
VRAIAGDIGDSEHREELVAAAAGVGKLDLVVNNASDLGGSPLPKLRDLEPNAYEQLLRTNVVAPQQLVRAVLPHLQPPQ